MSDPLFKPASRKEKRLAILFLEICSLLVIKEKLYHVNRKAQEIPGLQTSACCHGDIHKGYNINNRTDANDVVMAKAISKRLCL